MVPTWLFVLTAVFSLAVILEVCSLIVGRLRDILRKLEQLTIGIIDIKTGRN